VEIPSNSEFLKLTSSSTRSLGPPRLPIDVQDAYENGFGCSTYAWKEDEIRFLMAPLQSAIARYNLLPLLTKVTLLLLEGVATNMTLLQPYFTVAIDQFSSSDIWT
jgi:hypothetical protein